MCAATAQIARDQPLHAFLHVSCQAQVTGMLTPSYQVQDFFGFIECFAFRPPPPRGGISRERNSRPFPTAFHRLHHSSLSTASARQGPADFSAFQVSHLSWFLIHSLDLSRKMGALTSIVLWSCPAGNFAHGFRLSGYLRVPPHARVVHQQ